METYYIYKITNKKNNLSYIGQSINPQKRFKEHLYGRKGGINTYFDKALKKYGEESFTFEIIDKADESKKIDELEKYYIKKYNTLKPNGYNILKGGRNQQGAWNSKPIDEYDLNGEYINTYESASYYSHFVNKEYKSTEINRSCRKKTKYKFRQFRFKGDSKPSKYTKPNPNHISKVYQFDLNGNLLNEYVSITDASKQTNSSRTSICGCIAKRYKTANQYIWSKYKNINKINTNSRKKPIYMCDNEKNIIAEYNNAKEAERKNNFKNNYNKQILKKLNTNKLCSGYYWYSVEYYKDNIVPSLNKS